MGELPATAPAIGAAGQLTRRQRAFRVVVILAVALLVGGALGQRFLLGGSGGGALPPGIEAAWIEKPFLMRSAMPHDADFLSLRDSYGIDGVVDLAPVLDTEHAVAADLEMAYLPLPIEAGAAPNNRDLRRLVSFLRTRRATGGAVLVHDATGRDTVLVTALMLDMLRGVPAPTALRAVDSARTGGHRLTSRQVAAVNALAQALHQPQVTSGGSGAIDRAALAYPGAARLRW
jgi:hypothetical protein